MPKEKKKIGRPPVEDGYNKYLTMRFNDLFLERLKQIARLQGRSVRPLIRDAVSCYLNQKEREEVNTKEGSV